LTLRLKNAARRERARRYFVMYAVSFLFLLLLLAPLWILMLLWRS
jgi:hypothetical protein